MSENELRMWEVEVTRSTTVYVVARSRSAAEDMAANEVDSGDIDLADPEASARPITKAPKDAADEYPLGLGDDDDRSVADWLNGVPDLAARLVQWEAARPVTLDGLPLWLGLSPGVPRAWCGAVDGGAAATNGWAVLTVDGAQAAEHTLPSGKPWRDAYRKTAAGFASDREREGRVTLAALESWILACAGNDHRGGRVLGVLVDTSLVERWVMPAARIAGGAGVSVGSDLAAICWRGPRWQAATMPLRGDEEVAALHVTDVAMLPAPATVAL